MNWGAAPLAGLGVESLSAESFDLLALGLLMLCCIWGFWRGCASQLLSLGALLVALVGARWVGPLLEGPLGRVVGLPSGEVAVSAWTVAVGGLLLVAALLVHGLAALLPPRAFPRPSSRWLGGLLGGLKGAVLLVLLAYAAVHLAPPEAARAWSSGSRVLPALAPLRRVLSRGLHLPACTDEVAERVEALAPSGA